MNKNQRKRLEEAYDIVSIVMEEIEESISNLEDNFPNSNRLEVLEEEYDQIDEINDCLYSLIN